MKTWLAILLTLVVLFVSAFVSVFTGNEVYYVVIGVTSIWVVYDSTQIRFRKYKNTGIPTHPVALLIVCVLFWVVVFPWYLSTIRSNTL